MFVSTRTFSQCEGALTRLEEGVARGFLLVNALQVILKYAGSDCSEDLALHSPGAQALWRHYCIGRLRVSELRDCGGMPPTSPA